MKARIFWPLLLLLVLADCSTKRIVESELAAADTPHEVVGDVVRVRLAYNPGTVFGGYFGPYTRPGLIVLSFGVLLLLAHLYAHTPSRDRRAVVGLALICGGALGNLADRIRSAHGVVDFIDIGIGALRFWTFNIADIGVTLGAALLATALWREPPIEEPLHPAD